MDGNTGSDDIADDGGYSEESDDSSEDKEDENLASLIRDVGGFLENSNCEAKMALEVQFFTDEQMEIIRKFMASNGPQVIYLHFIKKSAGVIEPAVDSKLPNTPVQSVHYFLKFRPLAEVSQENFRNEICFGSLSTEDPNPTVDFLLNIYHKSATTPKIIRVKESPKKSDVEPTDQTDQTIKNTTKTRILDKLVGPKRTKQKNLILKSLTEDNFLKLTNATDLLNILNCYLVHLVAKKRDHPYIHVPPYNLDKTNDITEDELAHAIEGLMSHWIEQVYEFSFLFSKLDDEDHLGLLHHILLSEKRVSSLLILRNQLDSLKVVQCTEFLSSRLSPLPLLMQEATKTNEDNLKYTSKKCELLQSLLTPLRNIYNHLLDSTKDPMFELMAAMDIIYQEAPDSFRKDFCNLIVKASWDVTWACKNLVHLPDVFNPTPYFTMSMEGDDSKSCESPLDVAMLFCNDWISYYSKVYELFVTNGKQIDDANMSWLPSLDEVLLPAKLLLTRCEDLKYVWTSVTQLSRKTILPSLVESKCDSKKTSVKGTNDIKKTTVDNVEEAVSRIEEELELALDDITAKSEHGFKLTSKEWINHFDRFKESVEEVEHRYQKVMLDSLEGVMEAHQGLDIINRFKPVAVRKALFPVFYTMIDKVLLILEKEMENAERVYIFKVMDVSEAGFSYSEMAKWCLTTKNTIQSEIDLIKKQRWLPYSPRMDVAYAHWKRISSLLQDGAMGLYKTWVSTLEVRPAQRLMTPVMKWEIKENKHLLRENFVKELSTNLLEAQTWQSLGLTIPETLAPIARDKRSLNALRDKITSSANHYNALMQKLSVDEIRLLESHVQHIVANYLPAVTSLNWTNKQKLATLLDYCSTAVNQLSNIVELYQRFNKDLFKDTNRIKELLLYQKLDETLYSGDQFIEDVIKQSSSVIHGMRNDFGRIENDLFSLYEKIIGSESKTSIQDIWLAYVESVDNVLLETQHEVFRNSMFYMEKMLISSRSIPEHQMIPLFELRVVIYKGKISSKPLLDNLGECISHLADILLEEFNKIPCFIRRYNLEKSKQHNHRELLLDQTMMDIQKKIIQSYETKISNLQNKLSEWEVYRDVWENRIEKFIDEYKSHRPNVQRIKADIDKFKEKIHEIENKIDVLHLGPFNVNLILFKKDLVSKYEIRINKVLEFLFSITVSQLEKLDEDKNTINKLQTFNPIDTDSFIEIIKNCENITREIRDGLKILKEIEVKFDVLKSFDYHIPNTVVSKLTELNNTRKSMIEAIEQKEFEVQLEFNKFKRTVSVQAENLKMKISNVRETFKSSLPTSSSSDFEEQFHTIDDLKSKINDIADDMIVNRELEKLSLTKVQFAEEEIMREILSSLQKVWDISRKWQIEWERWNNFNVFEVSVISLEDNLKTYLENLQDIEFKDLESDKFGPKWEVLEDVISSINSMQMNVPVIECLQKAELKEHHWKVIQEIIAIDFEKNSTSITIGFLHQSNLGFYLKEIQQIVSESLMESAIMKTLDSVNAAWCAVRINTKTVKYLDLVFIKSTDETFTQLSNLLIELKNITNLQCSGSCENYSKNLTNEIRLGLDVLQSIDKFQKIWDKWAPFFNSHDVIVNLPHRVSFFEHCNTEWKKLTEFVGNEIFLKKIIEKSNLKARLKSLELLFHKIPDGIDPYLDGLRQYFPRYNFLSDDDVIEAVSLASDSEKSKSLLRKIFDNIASFRTQKNSAFGCNEITAIVSPEGETVELNHKPLMNANFTTWTRNLQKAVTSTLKDNLKQCRTNFKTVGIKLDELLKQFPLQVCVLVLHIALQADRQKSKSKSHAGIDVIINQEKYIKDVSSRFNKILMCSTQRLQREKVSNFYVTLLFLRDQLSKIRESKSDKTSSAGDLWLTYSLSKEKGTLNAVVSNEQISYGWEYLGMKPHPVFHEKMYHTLKSVIRAINSGSIPILVGGKSSGKTETLKLLAILTGCQFYAVKCNSNFKTDHLSRLLIGSLQLPGFLALENLQCLDRVVVSSLCDLLEEVVNEFQKLKTGSESDIQISYQGIPINLSDHAKIFLEISGVNNKTRFINETLKSACRPVQFFGLPIQVILEIELTRHGFKEAKLQSKKMVSYLIYLQKSLPVRAQYNFDVRFAIKVVNSAAKILRQSSGLKDFDIILSQMKEKVYSLADERDGNILEEIIPNVIAPETETDVSQKIDRLLVRIENFLLDNKWKGNQKYLDNLNYLYKSLVDNQLVLIFGKKGSGKSTAVDIVKTIETYESRKRIQILNVNPIYLSREISLEHGNIGSYLMKLINASQTKPNKEIWLVFKSLLPLSKWLTKILQHFSIENDSLYLYSPHKTLVPKTVRIIFIVTNQSNLTGGIRLNAGLCVTFNHDFDIMMNNLQMWTNSFDSEAARFLKPLLEKYLIPTVEILQNNGLFKSNIQMEVKVFCVLLSNLHKKDFIGSPLFYSEKHYFQSLFYICYIWTFGNVVDEKMEMKFMKSDFNEKSANQLLEIMVPLEFTKEVKKIAKENGLIVTKRLLHQLFICNKILEENIPLLLCGESGVGKTVLVQILAQLLKKNSDVIEMSLNSTLKPADIINRVKNNLTINGELSYEGEHDSVNIILKELHTLPQEDIEVAIESLKNCGHTGKVFNPNNMSHEKLPSNNFILTYKLAKMSSKLGNVTDVRVLKNVGGMVHPIRLPTILREELELIFEEKFHSTLTNIDQSVKSISTKITTYFFDVFFAVQNHIGNGFNDILTCHPRQMDSILLAISSTQQNLLDKDGFMNLFVYECFRLFSDPGVISVEALHQVLGIFHTKNFSEESYEGIAWKGDAVYFSNESKYSECNIDNFFDMVKGDQLYVKYDSLIHNVSRVLRAINLKSQNGSFGFNSNNNLIFIGPYGTGKFESVVMSTNFTKRRLVEVYGEPGEEVIIRKMLAKHSCVLILDWNIVNDKQNVAYINDLLYYKDLKPFNIILSLIDELDLECSYTMLPTIFKHSTICKFAEWSDADLTCVVNQVITAEHFKENILGVTNTILSHFKNCFTEAHEFSLRKHLPYTHLIEFCNKVKEHKVQLQDDAIEEKQNLISRIEKYEAAKKKIEDLSTQLHEQRAQVTYIQQNYGNTILKLKNIRSEQGRLEQELNKKNDLIARQKDEGSRIVDLINNDLSETKSKLRDVHKELDRLTVEEFDKIRGLLRPPLQVEKIFELTLRVIGVEPTWNEAKKQMADSVDFVCKIRKTSAENLDDNLLTLIQKIINSEQLNRIEIKNSFSTAAIFLSWLEKFENYAGVYKDYLPLQLQADAIEKDIQETQEALRTHKHDLTNFSVQQQVLQGQLKQREEQLDKAEQFMKMMESRIQMAQKVISQLAASKCEWENKISECSSKIRNSDGDAIITASYQTLMGQFPYDVRLKLQSKLKEDLNVAKIGYSEHKQAFANLLKSDDEVKWLEEGISADLYTLENLTLCMSTTGIKIVVDPHGVLARWFVAGGYEIKYVDLATSNLEQVENNEIYYYIVNETETSKITIFLESRMKSLWKLKKNSTNYDEADCWRLFILVKKSIRFNLPECMHIIHNGTQIKGIQKILSVAISNIVEPSVLKNLIKYRKELQEKDAQLVSCNKDVHKLMEEFETSILENEFVMEELLRLGSLAVEINERRCELGNLVTKTTKSIDFHDKTSLPLANLFTVLERLDLLHSNLSMDFDEFAQLIANSSPKSDQQIRWGNLLEKNTLQAAVSSIARKLQEQVNEVFSTAIGLGLVLWYHLHVGRITLKQIEVLTLMDSTLNANAFTSPIPWLEQDKWNNIIKLEKLKQFENLAQQLIDSSEEWLHWCSSEYIETSNFPKSHQKSITGFLKLLLTAALRFDRLEEAAEMYYMRILKTATKSSVESLQNTVLSVNMLQPIVLTSFLTESSSFFSDLHRSCYPLVEIDSESVKILSLNPDKMSCLLHSIMTSAKKGHWLILKCIGSTDNDFKFIKKYLDELKQCEVHKRFRLWLLTFDEILPSTSQFISIHRIYYSAPMFLRESVERCYKILGDNVLSLYNQDIHKSQLISVILFHISIVARQLVEEKGYLYRLTDEEWTKSEKMLRDSLSSQPTDLTQIEPFNLVIMLLPIYSNAIATERMEATLKHMIQEKLEMSAILDIPNRIPALTHYTVPDENNLDAHMNQLEFIYKASNATMSCLSQALVLKRKTQENKKILNAIKILFDIDNKKEDTSNKWIENIVSIKVQLENIVIKPYDSFDNFICTEISDFLDMVDEILTILKSNTNDKHKYSLLEKFITLMFRNKFSWVSHAQEMNTENCMNGVIENAKYLAHYLSSDNRKKRIALKYFINVEQFLMAYVRRHFPDYIEEDHSTLKFIYVPHSFRTLSGTSAQCLTLDELSLIGASWDPMGERLITRDKPYMHQLCQEISISVVVSYSDLGKRILCSDNTGVNLPVYRVDDMDFTPLFQITLPSSLDQEMLFHQAVRLIIG